MKTSRDSHSQAWAAALLALTVCAGGGCRSRPEPRLVVLIMIDALRADHLGCYGSPRGLTPEIDRLSERSVVFDNAHATSAWTKSSTASLFTSRYPSSLGVLGRADALSEEELTLATILRAQGWRTVGVSTNDNAGQAYGFHQGFDSFELATASQRAAVVTRTALRLVSTYQRRGDRRPLFLFLHYIDPHEPYWPNPGLLPEPEPGGRFDGREPSLGILDRLAALERTRDDEARIKYLYAGEVRYSDIWIGRLVEGLEDLGVFGQTLMVLTADHGEGLWDHGERTHGHELYQEQIHVPLLVHYPGMTSDQGRYVETPVSNVDVAPTILRALGIEPPAPFQGDDLAPLARGVKRRGRRAPPGVYSELGLDGRKIDTVLLDRMKLIRHRKGSLPPSSRRLELYDLRTDAGETVNLADQRPGDAQRLAASLREWRAFVEKSARPARRVDEEQLPERVRESLRALGYIE